MGTGWLKTICVAGLILAAAGWNVVRASDANDANAVMAKGQKQAPSDLMQAEQFNPTQEQTEEMLLQIRRTDPQKADELAKLREQDPAKFKMVLGNIMRERAMNRMKEQWRQRGGMQPGSPEGTMPEGMGMGPWKGFEGAGPEMMQEWMRERGEEYAKWLKENFPDEASRLEGLKDKNPEQYMRAMGITWKKYGRIYLSSKDNPQLTQVLKEQMALKDKRTSLLQQIKSTTDEKQKKAMTGELEQVVGQQFDLIVKRKQIAYEDMAKKLEGLKKEVDQRKAEVEKWKTKDFKNQQVKQRVNELLNETEKFEWD